ncbi:hypothetical protein [Fusobacterium perfoetens]|uniref:hypothetical protein n=1 Tax=Fusobacterium perfoetens TaxID=852 RepID=UPI000484CEDE|nr:hypothetical protein [Fusobacterium perfoetens]MCI6153138.1 hypothetical protein [Fusobacterium perfoetens]MDY3237068.1 hypothetical protein [Fusobacterium perfoetens]
MKKIIFGIFLLFSINVLALDTSFRIGAITNSSSYNKETNKFSKYAPSLGVEVTQSFAIADLGLGIAYNKNIDDVEVETVPVYGIVKYNFFPIFLQPYLVGKIGTVLYSDDNYKGKDASTYYGAGIGLNFLNMQTELLYSQTKMEDDKLDQVSLVFGINLF